jgi:hypothetical protein
MVRKGRTLEILVAHLEDHLGPLGIQVKSPDSIPDKDTSQLREVDISLRSQIGSSNILVIIECRDRKGDEDVIWIEQLSKKRESVCADKAVAISSSGFSKPATIKAVKENIELRTLEDVDPDEIGKWFQGKEGTHFESNISFKDISFVLSDGREINRKGVDLDLPIFKRKKDGVEISLRHFWMDVPKPIFYQGVPEDGRHVERDIIIKYVLDGEDLPNDAIEELENMQLVINKEVIDLKEINIHADLWLNASKVPIKAKHYRKSDGTIAEVIGFEFEGKDKKHAIEIISDPLSDKKRICLVPIGHNSPEKIDIAFTATEKSPTNIKEKSQDYWIRLGQKDPSESDDHSSNS